MKNYDATPDSIGNWGGREKSALSRWNNHVAPILNRRLEALNDTPDGPDDMDEEILDRCADAAWEAFVSSGVRAAIAQAEGIA